MSLALMIQTDEDALICDFAETYGILNFFELPVPLLATLCTGLREDARIIKKLCGSKLGSTDSLLAMMLDDLNWLVWSKTEDGAKNKNRPMSIYEHLQGIKAKGEQTKLENVQVFDSVDDFEIALAKAKGGKNTWQKEE